jgi:hypothetical protein
MSVRGTIIAFPIDTIQILAFRRRRAAAALVKFKRFLFGTYVEP